jgi:RHS repeat-associated protein
MSRVGFNLTFMHKARLSLTTQPRSCVRVLARAPALRTHYLYADEGLIAESTQAITLNADGSVSASTAPQITTQYGPRPDSEFTTGTLFVKTKNSNGQDTASPVVAYFHHDHLQTPLQATDKAGNVVWAASYNAFGKASITTPAATADKPTITVNLRLPGQYLDEETGLHYNWHRYYDGEIGRYTTEDPIGLRGGINRFSYAVSSPLRNTDPMGLWALGDPIDQRYVDTITGIGDGISGGVTSWIRDKAGVDGGVDKCSADYNRGELAGIVAGLVVPIGRISYVHDLSKIPSIAKSAEEAYAARNSTKAWYRGRPLAAWLERGRPNENLAELIAKKTEEGVIASAGRASSKYNYGIVGGGSAKTGNSSREHNQRDCGCGK